MLNACFSLDQAKAISEHIDCVIGMSEEIGDKAAITFSSAFYLAIASGRDVKNAFDQGITQIMLHGIPEEHIPKLLTRKDIDPSKIFLLDDRETAEKPRRARARDVDTILKERKDDLTPRPNESFVDTKQRASRYEKLLEKFHGWLLEQGYKINTARTACLGIMQLFRYYSMSITLRAGSPVSKTVVSTSDFILQPEHVRAMFHVAKDLRSKMLVSIGNDLGWRISDILSIKRKELPNLEQELPIEWIRITRKERVLAKSCLSKTTVTLLKEYLFSFPTENPYLFHNNAEGHMDEETITARLRDLARDSGIELGNMRLRWHCFRKMIISQAKNLGIDPDIIKLMVGKSVKKDILTYMTGIDVKTAFTKLQETLGIRTFAEESEDIVQSMETEIKELKQALIRVQQDANAYKKESEVLAERVTELEAKLTEHGEILREIPTMKKQIAYLKGTIKKPKPKKKEKPLIFR